MRDRCQRGRVGAQVRKQRSASPGPGSELRKGEVQEKLRVIIERETGTLNPIKEDVTHCLSHEPRFEPMRRGS